MTKSRTILLWGKEDILISSVRNILSSGGQLEVVNLPESAGIESLFQAVKNTGADTVIIHQGDRSNTNILTLRLLKNNPGLRVITINLVNNEMEVYSKQDIVVRASSDLISVIENGS